MFVDSTFRGTYNFLRSGRTNLKITLMMIGLTTITLSGCSQIGGAALGALTGGGPNVAANVQAAKTATQTVGKTEVQDIRAETVNQTTTHVTEIEPWLIMLLVVLALVLGSMVDDVIRIGWNKLWQLKRTQSQRNPNP
jgi:hypothetical protein